MSLIDAFAGGVHALFSIWIFCLMQVIPFFVAYVIGSTLLERDQDPSVKPWRSFGMNLAMATTGFIVVFTIMGLSATALSKALFAHVSIANQFGAVIIALLALHIAGALTLDGKSTAVRIGARVSGLALGAALALAYKPCVTPTLTYIYGLTQGEQTVARGGLLLVVYTVGEFMVISALAAGLLALALKAKGPGARKGIRIAAAVVMMAISVMILTNKMTIYKGFLVGGFVNQPGHDHSQMDHSKMNHDNMEQMDHSQMDHGAMDHMNHGGQEKEK
ncbi:MAG: hypothetical protein OEZ55_10435 [Nitrospinota bacterium]|nr:hypothetical protein [Nitrospinota bacterium]MDH5757074.1 hypothetical protein [Nitrospinota bacterium]